ncbi:sulfite oxidase-like protein [Pseudovirgaria hyperparasitica]|uniref:Nitrate reductase [NADPH] n=1 Tax=Pseudovirgaria hyperparasitica TaxID=470096 RepID=A0A6A6W5K9_9PEZI|nr:sulfite oxidase-like protein [Pseudovirgaria hyperparasitica]KAF2756341.1 sulfite oxidase-like protein [Pseudovirgaria hyperparasitica]
MHWATSYEAIPNVQYFRLAEVASHDASSDRQWITRGTSVYDITDFISAHPGGPIILHAAGGSIDPYWKLFTIHASSHVQEILAQYKIGEIASCDLVNGEVPCASIRNPYADDPPRDSRLKTLTENPRNAESPDEALSEDVTPNELFYVRNHFWVPPVKEEEYTFTVELPCGTERTYSLSDLKSFEPHTITATLQCAGNRRSHMSAAVKPTNGLPWNVGGISTATWTGARLADVLADAGLDMRSEEHKSARHADFTALEAYGASIPLSTAMDPRSDVLLAYAMNGTDLPRDHGYPVRVVAPGIVAARSVKWVQKVSIGEEESASQWQRRDYKCFGPNEKRLDWDKAKSIQEMPVMSAITGYRIKKKGGGWLGRQDGQKMLDVWGYAYSGGGREIVRVDVSLDGGKSWDQAELLRGEREDGSKTWAWTRWRYHMADPGDGKVEIAVKATDEAYNTQPERFDGIWNARGNLATAWHRVVVGEDET